MEVRFSLVLKTASFLGGRTWHCDMNFGRSCTGTPWTVGYGGGRMLVYSIAGDIILVVHGDLAVASNADLGGRLGDHKGA